MATQAFVPQEAAAYSRRRIRQPGYGRHVGDGIEARCFSPERPAPAPSASYLARLRAAAASPISTGLVLFACYLLIAIVLTWPIASRLNSGITSAIDPVTSVWRLGWAQHQLLHDPVHLLSGNIFYPYANTYVFDGMELGVAILTLPLALVALPPLAIYNCGILLSLALSALAMYLLAKRFGATPFAAFIAGAIYAFAPMHLDRIGHIAFLSTAWFPLILLFMDRILVAPKLRDALILAACLVMQALSTQYYAIFLAFFVPLFLLVMLIRRPEVRRRVAWGHLALAGLLALAIVAPFALVYYHVQLAYDVDRTYGQVTYYSATIANFFTADETNRLWGHLTARLRAYGTYTFERNMFPGVIALALAGIGFWQGRKRAWEQFLGALVIVSAALSFGPELRLTPASKSLLLRHLPYDIFYWHVPGFDSMRVPARFGTLFLLGLAGLAATGVTALSRWIGAHPLPRPRRVTQSQLPLRIAGVAVLLGLGAECANGPLHLLSLENSATMPPVYRWLASQPDARIIELPLLIPDHAREQQINAREQYFSLFHQHPTINGTANVLPKGYKALVLEMQNFPSPRSIALLQGLGITHVVIHFDQYSGADGAAIARRLQSSWDGLSLAQPFPDTSVYRLDLSTSFPSLNAAIPPGASIMLSRADPQGTGAYMGMLGYVLRDHPLYAQLRVDFGETYRGAPVAGAHYAYAILYKEEDPATLGFPTALVWQDGVARAYQNLSP
jgi:hypothetical protein